MSKRSEIRFGLGWPDFVRSALWRVVAAKDSSVYLLCDKTGGAVKTSHHPGRTDGRAPVSQVALTSDYVERNPVPAGRSRSSDDGIRRTAASTVRSNSSVPWSSAATRSLPTPATTPPADEVGVTWVQEIPPVTSGWQFTALLGDEDKPGLPPPGRQSMKAIPVGHVRLRTGADLWVMSHRIDLGPAAKEAIEQHAREAVSRLGPTSEHRVYRAQLMLEDPGLHSYMDLAVTTGRWPPTQAPPKVQASLDAEFDGESPVSA